MKFAFINSSIYIIGFNFKPELILLQQKINSRHFLNYRKETCLKPIKNKDIDKRRIRRIVCEYKLTLFDKKLKKPQNRKEY